MGGKRGACYNGMELLWENNRIYSRLRTKTRFRFSKFFEKKAKLFLFLLVTKRFGELSRLGLICYALYCEFSNFLFSEYLAAATCHVRNDLSSNAKHKFRRQLRRCSEVLNALTFNCQTPSSPIKFKSLL